MPALFLEGLTHRDRTRRTNRQLGSILAFVAGAVNAGGFLAVQRYTSHVTGVISAIADDLVLGHLTLALGGAAMLSAFLAGAMTTAILVNWARRHGLQGEFALPLIVEGALLVLFGLLGANLQLFHHLVVPATVLLLSFVMGLQNAIVTKVSRAEIRTTHMTGVVTDLGIELGRLLYRNHARELDERHLVKADRDRLRIHASILLLFLLGGIAGAVAFRSMGFTATLPIAALVTLIAAPPLLRDAVAWARRRSVDRAAKPGPRH